MERFLKKKKTSAQDDIASPSHEPDDPPAQPHEPDDAPSQEQNDALTHEGPAPNMWNSSQALEEINWEEEIQSDPGKRRSIDEYPPNLRDVVRRKYLAKPLCQPRSYNFKTTTIGGRERKFNPDWFDEFGSWLEYSEYKEKAYCFCCFLFRRRDKKEAGYAAFVAKGWSGWNKKHRLNDHVRDVNSVHNQAKRDCDALLQQDQHIYVAFNNQTNAAKKAHYTRLNASIDVTRVLLQQGLPFRGHDESEESLNKGNFKEFYAYTAQQNPELRKVVGPNATGNNKLTSSMIQKDIAECFAKKILHSILEEIGDGVFSLLVDESRDVAGKEQMAVVLRYAGKCGSAKESLVGLVHVKETTSKYLKSAIDDLFVKLSLSLKQVRGQGYDGASNMRGEFNGLQSLIMRENNTAYYVHCFAHQLQLVVVAVVRKHKWIGNFFDMISVLLNVVSGSSKRKDMIRDKYKEQVRGALGCGVLQSGTGLNQELALQRPGDTRWSSHQRTLKSLIDLFPTFIKLVEYLEEQDRDDTNRRQACGLLVYFQSFDFVFYLQLMSNILAITNTLSMALQRKNQDIVNAVHCVQSTKDTLNN